MKLIEEISCKDDLGNQYLVEVWQDFIEVRSGPGIERIPGMKEMRLADGGAVNFVDKDTFSVVRSGTTIRRA